MSRNTKDQLVAPQQPAVVFASKEAHEQIVARLMTDYEHQAHYAEARGTVAVQKREEVRVLHQEVNERLAMISEREVEQRQAEQDAQHARDIAAGVAALLAQAGVRVPPLGGELSHNPDGALSRLNAAHDELERGGQS